MGAWGEGVYDNDAAADVRDDMQYDLRNGATMEKVWKNIRKHTDASAPAGTEYAVCWGSAVGQFFLDTCGHLPETVCDAVLAATADYDAEREGWINPVGRDKVIAKLREDVEYWRANNPEDQVKGIK